MPRRNQLSRTPKEPNSDDIAAKTQATWPLDGQNERILFLTETDIVPNIVFVQCLQLSVQSPSGAEVSPNSSSVALSRAALIQVGPATGWRAFSVSCPSILAPDVRVPQWVSQKKWQTLLSGRLSVYFYLTLFDSWFLHLSLLFIHWSRSVVPIEIDWKFTKMWK